jgi:thiol-disulfide isomerase/thioredoxin
MTPRMLPSFPSAAQWLGSEPLTPDNLRGRVVLVDFWTFTCINWIRTLPYLRAWVERYGSQGLAVIGVHSPEFGFEHELDNVVRAAEAMGVDYPIVIDNDFEIWRSFDNNYWPALYIADADGSIRDHHFGEGRYEESERVIRRLLTESGRDVSGDDLVSVEPGGVEAGADWDTLRTPETYVGYLRAERFASPGELIPESSAVYTAPARLGFNEWALSGDWTVKGQPVLLNEAGGGISCRYEARDLNLVLNPSDPDRDVHFRVSLDGQPPGAAHGGDTDEAGDGTLSDGRLYQLIRQPGPVAEQTFEIEFLDPGAQAYVFTFG